MIERLDITGRLHARLLEIIRTALPLITSSMRDADLIGLVHLRGEMVDAIEAYCRHLHEVRDDAAKTADLADVAKMNSMVEGCAALNAAYETYRARWVHRRAAVNWCEYRLSAIVMMKQVRDVVQQAELLRINGISVAA